MSTNLGLLGAIDTLDGSCREVVERILRGEFSFWLGCAISKDRFPPLRSLLTNLLTQLHARIDQTNPSCPRLRAMETILIKGCKPGLDAKAPPSSWPAQDYDQLISFLVNKYSDIIGVTIGNGETIAWDLLCLDREYSNPAIEPDAEHILLALLIEEGIVPKIFSANWDALVEKAHTRVRGARSATLRVAACPSEIGSLGNHVSLLKFHGCAEKAASDPDRRQYMVATTVEIDAWAKGVGPWGTAAQTEMVATAARSSSFFLGLSGQDHNIRGVLAEAGRAVSHPDPRDHRIAIARSPDLSHLQILEHYYGPAYAAGPEQIEKEAVIPLDAKPLLAAIWLKTIVEKAKFAVSSNATVVSPGLSRELFTAITGVAREALKSWDNVAPTPEEHWRRFVETIPEAVSRATHIFRKAGALPSSGEYRALIPDNLDHMQHVDIRAQDIRFISTVVLCATGMMTNCWKMLPAIDPAMFILEATSGEQLPVHILSEDIEEARLISNGALQPNSDAILIFASGSLPGSLPPGGRQRMPGRTLPSSGGASVRKIYIGPLLLNSNGIADAIKEFKFDVAI